MPVGRRALHHMDFETLMTVNRQVVALTGEAHEYSAADGEKLRSLIKEVELRADNQEPDEAIPEKAALLVFKLASGQYFHAGNKRTSLLAGLTFLAKNGYKIDMSNSEFVSTVDRAGIGAATLDDVYAVMRGLAVKSAVERKGWDKLVTQYVESSKDFLTKMSS